MNPIGAAIIVVLGSLAWVGSRRIALWSFLTGILFLPINQAINIGGINIFAIRILEIVLFLRMVFRREWTPLFRIDKFFVLFFTGTLFVYIGRGGESPTYELGIAVEAILTFLFCRSLLSQDYSFESVLHDFAFSLAVFALFLAAERLKGINIFSAFGIKELSSYVRNDRIRCFGSFQHPSLLGAVGASMIPLYIGLAMQQRKHVAVGIVGLVSCFIIVFASNSGGPLSGLMVAISGWLLWKVRIYLKLINRAMFLGLVVLALVMKAPVWYLPARVSSLTGGAGWHRSYLLEMAFKDIDKWFLVGMDRTKTVDWFPYHIESTGSADITNEFVLIGLKAGVLAILLMCLLLWSFFKEIGKAIQLGRIEALSGSDREPILWGLGVTLVVHIITWFGITYFDQTAVLFIFHMAAISAITSQTINRHTSSDQVEVSFPSE